MIVCWGDSPSFYCHTTMENLLVVQLSLEYPNTCTIIHIRSCKTSSSVNFTHYSDLYNEWVCYFFFHHFSALLHINVCVWLFLFVNVFVKSNRHFHQAMILSIDFFFPSFVLDSICMLLIFITIHFFFRRADCV